MNLLDTALRYHQAGLTVLPNDPTAKYPASLKEWQTITPTETQIRAWYKNADRAIGLRDVEGLDFDNKGNPDADALYSEWYALVEDLAPGLAERLLLEKTPSGGYHTAWRCDVIAGNLKLATRPPTAAELQEQPKLTFVSLIETRGKGGQFQVAPSPGYQLVRGDWADLPHITPAERLIIMDCARALSRSDRRTIERVQRLTGDRPGDLFNQNGADEALSLLEQAGWREVRKTNDAIYLCRPGKVRGVSATFGYVAPGVLYVFSGNASPFEANRAYGPFAILTELSYHGDYKAAAAALRAGQPARQVNVVPGEIEQNYTTTPKMPIDVNDLLAMERKPTIWFAPGFLREGLGLLVGQPNVGKTPLAVQLAIALATGRPWMGTIEVPQTKVLYLGVEYSAQELIPLVDISRCGVDVPRGQLLVKTIEDDFPTTPEDAIAELEWYIRVLDVRVIIIDVLTAFLPPEKFKQNVYRGDYSELKPYHKLALKYNAAILGTWHGSKREADPKIMYNGSTGMWAAAASRITMYTDKEERIRIASFPRMSSKVDYALTQERTLTGHRWIVADVNPEPAMSPTETQLYRFLKQHATKATPLTPSTVAEMTGVAINTVKVSLRRMFEKNIIQQSGASGGYFVVTDETVVTRVTDETPVTDVTLVTDETDTQRNGYKSYKELQNGLQGFTASESAKPGTVTRVTTFSGYNEIPDVSSHPIFAPVEAWKRSGMLIYLRSNVETDQEHARALCDEAGIDYQHAYNVVRGIK